MEPPHKHNAYHPQHYFHYPFTLVSHPKKTFLSKPIQQPTAYEVYCPISCKKIKIGAAKPKQKEGVQFNTTSSRLVSTILNKQIKYLINGNPPNKRDKKQVEGSDWSFWIEVAEKGNLAIFNPYCYIPNDPLSLYTFSHLAKFQQAPVLPQFVQRFPAQNCKPVTTQSTVVYVHQNEKGSYIGTNTNFDDAIDGKLTFINPKKQHFSFQLGAAQALKLIPALKQYWLHQLHIHMIAQKESQSSIPKHNLDEVYEGFGFALNLQEQLRAKLSNTEGIADLDSKLGYHPRLYSAINRLASFINYGVTKFNKVKLAELGFYNRSDMLQDLRYFEWPEIPIPSVQNPWYQSEAEIRRKLFPFSRLEREIPNSNVDMKSYIRALLHQKVSTYKIKHMQVNRHYILFVDQDNVVSVWSCRLFPLKLFSFSLSAELQTIQTQIAIGEKELQAINSHIQKQDNALASLFEEVAPPPKQEKPPAETVPDPSMIEHMQQMGYGIGLIKKALIKVKNESIPAALDVIEGLMAEQKKKIKQKKSTWNCPACTYINKPENDTCEICGEIYVAVDESEKERERLEKEAELERQKKQNEEKQKALKQAEEAKLKAELLQAQKLKQQKQKQQMLKKAQLLATKFLYRQKSPLDPFFIVQLYWNSQLSKCCLKVTRVGVSRQFFARFYRIQDKILSSNLKRFPMPLTFQSFEQIAEESADQRQWGLRLIQPSHDNQWGVIATQEKELPGRFTDIQINFDTITLKNGQDELHFSIVVKDSLEKAQFQLINSQKPQKQFVLVSKVKQFQVADQNSSYQYIQIKPEQMLQLDDQVSQIHVEVLQHLPGKVWTPCAPQSSLTQVSTAKQGQIVLNQLIPLFIEDFEGSVFSGKHYSTTVLEKGPNLYISNYPNISFTFRHLKGKSVFAESVVIISSSKRLQRIFSVFEGLIFTADQPSWFHVAKQKFQKFSKIDYEQWLTTKKARNEHRQFWEPVAFFQFQGETQIEIDYKRTAKYVFLLPTNVKGGQKKKDQVYAIKLDFFGVKGRIEEDKTLVKESFKHEGSSGCSVQLQRQGVPVDPHSIVSKVWGNVNSFFFHTPNPNFLALAPLSTTTVFLYKLRSKRQPISLKVSSKFAKKISVWVNREISIDIADSSAITSFSELARVQNEFSAAQLKKIAQKLKPRDLLELLLKADRQVSSFEALIKKLQESIDFKEKLFLVILELVPILVDNQIQVTEAGFKSFLTLYEKEIGNQPSLAFAANTDALRKISIYVSQNRNKNYNILRSKYSISELVLQPYLFSKDYYRMVYPNYVEQELLPPVTTQPTGPVNCYLYTQQITPYFYRYIVDLQQTKKIEAIRFYVPKITAVSFRPKLTLNIWKIVNEQETLIYSRYFHQDLLVQLGINGFKDVQIYRGQRLNCLSVPDVQTEARFLKVQYSFILATTQPHTKYKDYTQKFLLIPLIEGTKSQKIQSSENILQSLKKYPQDTKHLHNNQKLPPCRYSSDGNKSTYAVHQFPVVELSAVKKQYREIIDKITANIMDQTIVKEAVKGLKISHYEFNRKGIDFAYTYIIHLMNLSKRFPNQMHVSVQLMLELFEVLVVFESGPIMRRTFAFLEDNYKRLSHPQRVAFIDALMTKYLESVQALPSLRIVDRYSPQKILEKLQNFELPISNIFVRLEKSTQKSFKILSLKLISSYLVSSSIVNLELYCTQTGKYLRSLKIIDILFTTFSTSIWVLTNVTTIKQQILGEALDLLLLIMSGELGLDWKQPQIVALKQFIELVNLQDIWKLVFLTLRLRSQNLKNKINKLFAVLTANMTEKFKRSINDMLQQIIVRKEGSLYVTINPALTDQLWMNHLQTTLELVSATKDSLFLDLDIALKLLQLPLTPRLWSLALHIIPRNDQVLMAIIKNFPNQFYSSLGKQITSFCQPLAGIRSLESMHINWLDLVRQIRLEGKNLLQLLAGQLEKSSFGGKEGLTMATTNELKQLQIACQLAKLISQSKPTRQYFNQGIVRRLVLWYFLNKSKEKGASPATQKILLLSQTVRQLLGRLGQFEETTKLALKILLEIRREGELVERNFLEKRIPVHSALTLNKRFCECFEELLNLFMTSDQLCGFFAFQLKGLDYILRTMDIEAPNQLAQAEQPSIDEQLLVSQKIISQKKNEKGDGREPEDLKQEQFANNVKIVPNLNLAGLHASNVDWTIYKKGNKTKIIFLSMVQPGYYHQHALYIQLTKTAQIRSIKIGFPAASYQFNDKLVATPSGVIIEGSIDGVSFEPIGEMDYLRDDAYIMSGVQVWVLNCQRLKGLKSVGDAVQGLGVHRAKYLKIIVKRPIITFIEGQYSQLNGRNYSHLGCSLSFLSVTGDDAQKITSWQGCKQSSKRSVLRVLSTLLNQTNNRTMRRIANDDHFSGIVKTNFKRIREYMTKYNETMPQIIYLLGAGNRDLGDWIVGQFLTEGGAQSEAKIVNQIITSTPDRAFNRLARFLKSILQKLNVASDESQIEAAVIYTQEIHFIESFCKTLQESYELGIQSGVLQVSIKNINSIVNIYDRRYSSPDIKSAVKLLVNLLYLKKPLKLSEELILPAMNIVWQNCSEQKPHFYQLMSALLVDRGASAWLVDSKYSKVSQLIQQTYSSCSHSDFKSLKLQLLLLSQISHHQPDYLRECDVHLQLYNRIKLLNYQENDITDAILKLMRNVVLGSQQQERRIAKLLYDDVGLLVKRKDPFLQKLFVGLLGLQQEVMINLQGLQLQPANKKEVSFKSKFLTHKQSKIINDKISKKSKFNLLGEINGPIKADHQDLFLKAFSCNSFIMVMRFKINDQIHTCGVYSSTPGRRNQEGDYLWEQIVYYEKSSFIFFLQEPTPLFINNQGSQSILGNIYGGEEEQDNGAVFYDDGNNLIQFAFNTSDSTVPKLHLSRFKQQLSNQLTNSTLDSESSSYSFVGLQFWELKTPNTVHVTDSKISNLLSKSNHAKPPFSYYRHFPIYIFPANITVSKFMGILGLKGSCFSHSNLVPENQMLADLEKLSSDFIIDLNIQSQDSQEQKEEVSQIGYIPVMRIFNHFSAMDGVVEVLRLGSQSIKDWKKADRKKNFQHYMQQLKSFINLPSFFYLFIKNQQYVTLLFEVASGMPDDESSTRNWQEQYVNNFRFIYKIVSDIFKFDRSPNLRDMDRYSDFADVILEKLSQITKQAPRILKEDQNTEQKNEPGLPSLTKVKSQDRKRKKKGTGYGSDNQNNSKWSASEWLQSRKNVSQQTLRVISIIASFLDCEVPLKDTRLSDIIKESCLLPLLQSAVRSGSLLDISKEPQLFKAYLQIVKLISSHPSTIDCVLDLDKRYKPEQSESIYSLLNKLNGTATIFSECLKSGKDSTTNNETAEGISIDIQKTYQFVDKSVKNMKKKGKGLSIKQINNMPVAEAYRILLGSLRFGYINIKEGNVFKHAHSSSISTANPATSKILRLSQELADLSTSLPCEHTNSIFVRCDQSRIDVITIMIMGSKDTPYSNGAFTFDVYCDDSYPNNPPKMLITTTGSGKIRFNPNLYSCGKVCLSLLGTWRGSASENWDPKVSTLLQLFISTQGITMSDDVYFNEPGFEGQQGTEEGERKNQAYSNIVRLGNVRYAMNGQLKNPPKGFEQVVKRHFYIKQKEIIEQCQKWVQWAEKREASYNGLVNDHNSSWCSQLKQSKTKYRELLVKEVEQLKELLSKLPAPDLKEKEEQPTFLEEKTKEKKQVKAVEMKLEEVDVQYDKQPHQVKEYGEQVLQDRWSRYIGAMGLEAVKKQAQSSVLLIGLKPLGLQIAKNLVLSGLKKLTIFQDQTLQNNSQHFYMANVKSNSYKDCVFKIKELNPYMLVQHVSVLPEIEKYSIIVSTSSYQFSRSLAEKARKAGVKFIYTQTKGVSGIYFADLGQHQINDDNGEEPFEGMIKSITNQEEGVVTLLDGIKHPYQDGDYIVLSKVEGMQIVSQVIEEKGEAQTFFEQQSNQKINGINNRAFKIKVINWNSFKIGDTRNFTPYKNNGLCRNLKVPKKVQYESLEVCSQKFENYLDSNLGIYDFEKIGQNLSIFLCFKALSQYQNLYQKLPANWSVKDSKAFLSKLEQLAKPLSNNQQQLENIVKFGSKFGLVSEAELPTIGAYLGGIVSQQIVKAITNKYTPIKQFFTFHFNQLLQKIPQSQQQIQKLAINKDEEFKNIKIVVGRSAATKIQQLKTFVIGAGAIGCELLKNFAMVNMGAKGEIVVTDPDHIETSNLSRQFLFRDKHVKKAKSATACATLLQLNPKLQGHIHARLDKVCQESQEIYSNQFFKSRNIVANALDNVRARQYMDKRCVENKVPLFQSGTLGPKGHVQVIVPNKTQNYGSQNDPNEQTQIPHCTLKMFPEETVHCIEWARDIFGKIFTLNPKAFKKVLQAKDIKVLEGQQRETVAKMIKYLPESFEDCIAEAVRKFYIYYRNNVRQLLFTYPIDLKTKEGKPFWTLPKRPPKQINELDTQDEVHRTFIAAYSVLLAKTYSLPYPKDFRNKVEKDGIMSIARKVKVEDFVPNAEASKQLEKEVQKENNNKQGMEQPNEETKPEQNHVQKLLSEQIDLNQQILEAAKPIAEEFEKDEDSNGHIDLIYSMSNLRCRNYGLNECSWIEAKLKAGKIMAALSTTTSVVAALQTLQIIKLATGGQTWRNAFTNLAVPLIQITEPGPAVKYPIGNTTFTVWEEWVIKCSTLKDLLTKLKQTYNVEAYNISLKSGKPVYWEAMYADKEESRQHFLGTKLKTMFEDKVVELNIAMRKVQGGQNYENVPKVKIEIQQ